MGIVSNITGFRKALSAEAPSWASPWSDGSHLEQTLIKDLYGLAESIHVTRARARRLDVVSKGEGVYTGQLSRMTLINMKGNQPAPVQMSLLAQPEKSKTLASSLAWLARELYYNDRAWWLVTDRDFYGWPVYVERVERSDAGLDKDGKLVTVKGEKVEARDVIEFESPTGGLLNKGDQSVRRAIVLNRAAALAEDSPVPAVDLHWEGDDLTTKQIDELLDSWQNARRERGVGFSSRGLKVTTLGTPVENFLIDARRAADLSLARHSGLPAWSLDIPVDGQSMTYENRASRNWELIDLGLSPMMTAITSRLSMGDVTPRGWSTIFRTDDLTREDMKTRFDTYKVGKDGGFIDNDMIAAWEGWERTPA